jgi:hypothetical protein
MSNSFKIRNYITARSEKRLRRLMFDKQIELGMAALAFDITYANKKWVAWYYEILTNDKLEILDDTTENNRG